ncbi:MAG: hypothetical protein PG977_001278 [Bartonella clarridgeiae]|nr:MAG: hypothetical protein PG977_001278 [Bartonella clarridgeiae]
MLSSLSDVYEDALREIFFWNHSSEGCGKERRSKRGFIKKSFYKESTYAEKAGIERTE